MDFSTFQRFLAVAEELHFTRAAERLQVAQPNLTRTIHRLEEEVGFALFDRRNKRQLALTPAGQALAEQLSPILAQYEEVVQTARRVSQRETGKLIIGYGPAAMLSNVLPAVVRAYEQIPQMELVLRDLSTQSYKGQVKALREHLVDVLFLLKPFDEPGMAHRCVSTSCPVVVLPDNHRLAHLAALPLAALASERWIWASRTVFPRVMDDLFQLCRQAGFEPRIVRALPQGQAIVSLVANGVGIAVLNAWAQRGFQQQGVVYRPLLDSSYLVELHVLWRDTDRSPLVQRLLQVIQAMNARQEDTR